ncbi:MAG: hypothetical protein WKF87_06300 [Chryseolinea sp.]
MERNVVVFFQVHQPRRLRTQVSSQNSELRSYFDEPLNESIMKRVAHDCYEPANAMLHKLKEEHPGVKVCFSISGEALDQLEKYAPDILLSFKELTASGTIEMLAQPSYHSLSGFISAEEFQAQIVTHMEKIRHHFDVSPTVCCNPELIYNDELGSSISQMGFEGILCEGAAKVISMESRDRLYRHPEQGVRLLLRNQDLSDKIASRFGAGETTLTVKNITTSIDLLSPDSTTVLIGLDYEILGDQLKKNAGIMSFIGELLVALAEESRFRLCTASEALKSELQPAALTVIESTSWSADSQDVSTWLGNDMQKEAFALLAAQQGKIMMVEDEDLLDIWRSLQTTDHFFYMSSHKLGDDNHRRYFSQYPSPYEAFINYMNILKDLISNLQGARVKDPDSDHAKILESERQHPKIPVWAMQKELQNRLSSEQKP